jgi:alpha-mannosidase
VDVSECGYGVALLNDGKYGHSVESNKLSITLLKCATDPNPCADEGKHYFTYSLMPHTDDFRRAGVIEESYALNQPLWESVIGAKQGELAERYSFVSADKPNAVITAVKKAEADDGLIVRFYDAYDCKSDVTISVPAAYNKAYLCDLMENELRELEISEGKVKVAVSNFEIVTLKFVL